LQGLTPEGIRRLLHEFVCGGGRLEERREARPEWLEVNADRPHYYRDFWYRAIVPVAGLFPSGLFVEIPRPHGAALRQLQRHQHR